MKTKVKDIKLNGVESNGGPLIVSTSPGGRPKIDLGEYYIELSERDLARLVDSLGGNSVLRERDEAIQIIRETLGETPAPGEMGFPPKPIGHHPAFYWRPWLRLRAAQLLDKAPGLKR